MAHKKAGGSTALGRDSHGQRLGVKLTEGAQAQAGSIIIRQRGSKYIAGTNVKQAKDDTLFSMATGFVHFSRRSKKNFDGRIVQRTVANVVETKQKGGGVK